MKEMMIMTARPRHAGRIAAIIGILALWIAMPAYASEPDFEAVERRLGKAVSKGELSLEQAAAMMRALRNVSGEADDVVVDEIAAWAKSVGSRLKEAVAADKISEEEAWKKWEHFKHHELAPKLKGAVREGEVSDEAARRFWHHLEDAEMRERHKRAAARDEKGGDRSRAGRKKGKRRHREGGGIHHHFREMGISDQGLGRIKKALAEAGVAPEQMEGTLGGMLRVMHGMKAQGEDYSMDQRLETHFRRHMGFSEAQIKLVQDLARRALHDIAGEDVSP